MAETFIPLLKHIQHKCTPINSYFYLISHTLSCVPNNFSMDKISHIKQYQKIYLLSFCTFIHPQRRKKVFLVQLAYKFISRGLKILHQVDTYQTMWNVSGEFFPFCLAKKKKKKATKQPVLPASLLAFFFFSFFSVSEWKWVFKKEWKGVEKRQRRNIFIYFILDGCWVWCAFWE